MKYFLTVLATLVLLNTPVLRAATTDVGGDGKAGGEVVRVVTLDDFKNRCANPENTDVQRPPQNIVVHCMDSHKEFVASDPGEVPLPSERLVGAAISSSKFLVNPIYKSESTFPRTGTCMRFKEVQESMILDRSLGCAEVLNMKGDINDYCSAVLDVTKGTNPKLLVTKDTGTLVDTCAGLATVNDGKGDGKGKGSE